ncbi:MAG: glycine cleavage system protein T [Candidatus Binatia bacterium]|nr:MAG: glycine cleavage system protein T [Candidatus Binatia bacterium]
MEVVRSEEVGKPVEFLGASLPACFSGVVEEWRAVREGVGVFPASFRRWVRVYGADREAFLQGMVTNDVRGLVRGRGLPAAILTVQGKVVTDLRIYAGEDSFLLDFPASGAGRGRETLERHVVADDVELEEVEGALLGLEGRELPRFLEALGFELPGSLVLGSGRIAGYPAEWVTASLSGEPGLLLRVEDRGLWDVLCEKGAVPVGALALDVLRLEAGVPLLGRDMDETTLLMEVGLEDAVSFRKGCYVGQEVVERIAARGHVNRLRVLFVFDGEPVPPRTPLACGGKEVGFVTSSAFSPLVKSTLGMGYVRREFAAPGTELDLEGRKATVVPPPFRKTTTEGRKDDADATR